MMPDPAPLYLKDND